MPLLKPDTDENTPEVNRALEAAGLLTKGDGQVSSQLDASGLSLSATLDKLVSIAESSESDHLRLRAVELALKLHGALKPDSTATAAPSISINIHTDGENPVKLDFLKPPAAEKVPDTVN